MWALGFGSGPDIETGAGLFQLLIAAGRTEAGSFDFRQPKIHLGVSTLFCLMVNQEFPGQLIIDSNDIEPRYPSGGVQILTTST